MIRKILIVSFWILGLNLFAQEKSKKYSLEESIKYTLKNNFNVKSSDLNVEIANQKVRESIAVGLPQVSGNLNYDYYINQPVSILPDFISPAVVGVNQKLGLIDQQKANDAIKALGGNPPREVTFGTKNSFSAGVKVEQLLFSGSYLVGLQSAKAFKEISVLGKEKTESELKEAVINAYTAVVVAEENVKIIEKNLKVSSRNLFEIEEIYKAGFAEQQSVDQIKYMKKSLENSLNYAKSQREIAESTLKLIMGIDQKEKLILTTNTSDLIAYDLLIPTEVDPKDLENHIDYRLAKNRVLTSELQVKYEKSKALPSVSAFLNHAYTANSNQFLLNANDISKSNTTVVGLRMMIPIFSSFSRASKTQQAQLELEKAEQEKLNVKQQLIQKLNKARLGYLNAQDNYRTAKDLVNLSQSIYDKEKIKFKEGISTSNDLATSEKQLYDSENKYIQSILQVIYSKTELYKAMGKY